MWAEISAQTKIPHVITTFKKSNSPFVLKKPTAANTKQVFLYFLYYFLQKTVVR